MTDRTVEDIRHYEGRLRSAMLGSDLAELDALLSDELVFADHLGAVWRKQDDLDAHRSGAIRVRSVAASQESIRLVAGVAIVSVVLKISGTFGGEEASGAFRFTRVWAPAHGGRWQVVAGHSSLLVDRSRSADFDGGE